MSRKKIVIELTRLEAETLRRILGRVYVGNLIPEMTGQERRTEIGIVRKVFNALYPDLA
jgi:hypothetical protein